MIFEENVEEIFSKDVENHVIKNGGGYIDAVLELCEKHNIEPQLAAKFLSKPIVEKLHLEGQKTNILPRSSKLPV